MVNKKACGASGIYGANTSKGCPFDFTTIKGVGIMSPSARFTGGVVDEASIKALQLAGKIEVLQGVDGVEFTSDEDTITASTNGTKRRTLPGKYQIKVTFLEDFYFQSVLTTISSFKNWDTFLWDDNGNYLFTQLSNGDVKGFSTGMLNGGMYGFNTADTLQNQTLEFQWLERDELDLNYAYVDNAELDFNPKQYEGVVQANVEFSSIPQDADTALLVKASYFRGGGDIEVLDKPVYWKVLVDGVLTPASLVSYASGVYSLTVPAVSVAQEVEISLDNIIDVTGDCLYKSNTDKETVVPALP